MRFKLFEEFLNEGVNDPGILKAFFMAGGPGSGKSYVATELFGFPKGAQSSVSYATGLKLVNNDNAFEKALKDAGLDVGKLAQYAADSDMWDNIVMPLRDKAKGLTRRMQNNYIAGRLGQVVDGTGKDFKKIEGMRKLYQDLGYDTYMVFVNTSLDVALERNRNRERKLDDKMVEKMWRAVQENLGKFQKLFGRDRLLIVDNSSYDNDDILDQIEKAVMSRINAPIQNPIGRKWVQENSPQNRKRNQPFGVRESLNEAEFSDYDNNELMGYIRELSKQRADAASANKSSLVNSLSKDIEKAEKELGKRSKKLVALVRTDESLNEGLKITAKMPATMKKFIDGLAKERPNTWSNELTDLANSIIGAHREYDLDLADSDKVDPQYINIRMEPASNLTSRSIDMINQVWDNMGDQAKESIYADYAHWFKVGKKDRPLYGMYEAVVNEAASRTAMEIGGLTGVNKEAIQKFVDDNNLDIEKVFQYVKKGKLSARMDFATAVAGKPNNTIQKKVLADLSEATVNERKASLVGRHYEPDYKEVMELLEMAEEFINTELAQYKRGSNPVEMYWSDDFVRFEQRGGNISNGYDKSAARRRGIFPGKQSALYTLQKANYNPEETKKQVEKHFKGRIGVEFAKWQGEVTGVNYIFK